MSRGSDVPDKGARKASTDWSRLPTLTVHLPDASTASAEDTGRHALRQG
jgi:hypothetical protein